MWVCIALVAVGMILRDHIGSWFEGSRPALAGLVGAIAATLVGTIANDSGALLLMIGTGFAALFVAFVWAKHVVKLS
jgi:chromate transport protein ChrA